MKKKYLIFVLIIVFCSCSKGKSNSDFNSSVPDSLNYYLKKTDNKALSNRQKVKALNKALTILKNADNSIKLREKNYELISKYYEVASWNNYKIASEVLLKNASLAKDTINLANSFRSLGNYFYHTKQIDSSFYYYSKSEKIYQKVKDFVGLSTIQFKKAVIQFKAKDHLGADLSLIKALASVNKTNDDVKKLLILNQLGRNSNELREYRKAITYFEDALVMVKANVNFQDNFQESVCLSNIGLVYQNFKNHAKAISFFEKSLNFNNLKIDYPEAYSNTIDNLAYSKLQENRFSDLPKLFYEALDVRKKLNDNSAIIISYIHLSEYYIKIDDKQTSLDFANQALKLAKTNKNPIELLYSLKQASAIDQNNASLYSDEYIRISDSLQLSERQSKDRFNRIQFETDEIIKEVDVLENKNRTILYVFLITFILVSLLFVVRAQRTRTRELLFKQAQQKSNEDIFNLMMSQQTIIDESRNKEKKRLAQDLHDGVLGRMFGLRLNLDSLNSSTDADAPQKRHELLNELKTIEQDIREISHDLNREKLVLINNFVSIVHNLLEEQKTLHDAEVTYQINTNINWDKIGNAIKINLYRILQEGLQNSNKYASAKNIKVEISGDAENVFLKLQDDGIGFDVNKKSKGIGMQNMISRTKDCHGVIDIKSKKGEGTKIVITVPKESKPLTTEKA